MEHLKNSSEWKCSSFSCIKTVWGEKLGAAADARSLTEAVMCFMQCVYVAGASSSESPSCVQDIVLLSHCIQDRKQICFPSHPQSPLHPQFRSIIPPNKLLQTSNHTLTSHKHQHTATCVGITAGFASLALYLRVSAFILTFTSHCEVFLWKCGTRPFICSPPAVDCFLFYLYRTLGAKNRSNRNVAILIVSVPNSHGLIQCVCG